jgi:hypothetical protein
VAVKVFPLPAVAVTAWVAIVTVGRLIGSEAVKLKVITSPILARDELLLLDEICTEVSEGAAIRGLSDANTPTALVASEVRITISEVKLSLVLVALLYNPPLIKVS